MIQLRHVGRSRREERVALGCRGPQGARRGDGTGGHRCVVDRIERRLAERKGVDQFAIERKREHQKEMVLGSMAISIPLLAIAAVFTGLAGSLHRSQWPELLGQVQHRRRASGAVAEAAAVDGD